MRHILLSVDHEIFGNGAGDVRRHVVEPMERMARICERHGAPLTIFFETEEYLAFERFGARLEADLGYNAAKLLREQAAALARRGHDIQLHLHPQWFEADYNARGWILNHNRQTVDELFPTAEETLAYIAERKAAVEELSGKPVRAYRAGAFSAQPGGKLLRALAENKVCIDSSVVKGLCAQTGDGNLDYRGAPCAKGPWRVQSDVAAEDPAGRVWEFPIYSVMGRRLHQATWKRFRAKFSRHVPKAQKKAMVRQLGIRWDPFHLARFLFQPVPIKLDFHNVSPARLLAWIQAAPGPRDGHPDVVVLIGHTKEHRDDRPLERLLDLVSADPNLKVASFSQVADMLPAEP